jgi:alpha-L-fucosidase
MQAPVLTPYGPAPSSRQRKWHSLELYGFLHFTVNTFTDKEWGYGDESPAVFNPSDFDADQLVTTAKSGGLQGLILTCKHHDGFCLWPSAYTEHSVKNSPWRGGKGDVVREVSQACARHGLKFGVYLSPWDRNHAAYGTPAYIEYYRSQLQELLSNYGPLFEVWFDGANGGDGYYGGARETRLIDKTTYYDWDNTWKIVRELQPDACIFSDAGPDVRWVGNEDGSAGDPCWATLMTEGLAPGLADSALLNAGQRDGSAWLPAECDVSIRPGWFYHASEDAQVKTPAQLLDLYMRSVGRGASLLLNLPPDRRGRIHEIDAAALRGFHELLSAAFQTDLARSAQTGSAANDGNPDTFWSPESTDTAPELTLEFKNPVCFNCASLREYIPLGQRVDAFVLDAWLNNAWVELARGQSIGSRRLLRFTATATRRVRLRIVQAAAPPAISEFALYYSAVD